MTFEISLVLGILVISLILFISEVIRMDVVALLVLGPLTSAIASYVVCTHVLELKLSAQI